VEFKVCADLNVPHSRCVVTSNSCIDGIGRVFDLSFSISVCIVSFDALAIQTFSAQFW
jgi:hypothetical protein